jgi:hypothetical protein
MARPVTAIGGSRLPLLAGFLVAYPGRQPAGPPAPGPPGPAPAPDGGSLLGAALRDRGVRLGAVMLAVYVGLELSGGNWGFSYLVQARAPAGTLAGYTISGYWAGLTLGRFLISPLASPAGLRPAGMIYGCLAGIVATIALAWLLPIAPACVALGLAGFFLGPVFPTTMAIAPRLTSDRLVPTAIGVINAPRRSAAPRCRGWRVPSPRAGGCGCCCRSRWRWRRPSSPPGGRSPDGWPDSGSGSPGQWPPPADWPMPAGWPGVDDARARASGGRLASALRCVP